MGMDEELTESLWVKTKGRRGKDSLSWESGYTYFSTKRKSTDAPFSEQKQECVTWKGFQQPVVRAASDQVRKAKT